MTNTTFVARYIKCFPCHSAGTSHTSMAGVPSFVKSRVKETFSPSVSTSSGNYVPSAFSSSAGTVTLTSALAVVGTPPRSKQTFKIFSPFSSMPMYSVSSPAGRQLFQSSAFADALATRAKAMLPPPPHTRQRVSSSMF